MSQEERIKEFMRLQQQALEKTGITYAVESGKNLVVFDTQINEPVELEIMVGTDVTKKDAQITITTFDRSHIESKSLK